MFKNYFFYIQQVMTDLEYSVAEKLSEHKQAKKIAYAYTR